MINYYKWISWLWKYMLDINIIFLRILKAPILKFKMAASYHRDGDEYLGLYEYIHFKLATCQLSCFCQIWRDSYDLWPYSCFTILKTYLYWTIYFVRAILEIIIWGWLCFPPSPTIFFPRSTTQVFFITPL